MSEQDKVHVLEFHGFESILDIEEHIYELMPDGEWEGILTIKVSYREGETCET